MVSFRHSKQERLDVRFRTWLRAHTRNVTYATSSHSEYKRSGPGLRLLLATCAWLLVPGVSGCSSEAKVGVTQKSWDTTTVQPDRSVDKSELSGKATWYGKKHHGRTTANGEKFDMHAFTAAHKTLPFNTIVRVTNTNNNKNVVVRINDRGPYGKGRVIDLSHAAAEDLGMIRSGVVPVYIEILVWGDNKRYH